jgi:hypothetical protein
MDEGQSDKNIAIVEMPSGSNSVSPKMNFLYFKLDKNNEWFVTTPFIIKLSDWICVSANEPAQNSKFGRCKTYMFHARILYRIWVSTIRFGEKYRRSRH